MKHVITALVENHSGVLARVATLISGRGFNIDSLAVGETQDPEVSRMTIVIVGDDRVLQQVIRQIHKLIDVIKIEDIQENDKIDRELMLVKIEADTRSRLDVMQIVNTFRAKIVDVNPKTIVIEVTGNESKIDAMLELLIPLGVKEVVRTGLIAMSRRNSLSTPPRKQVKIKKLKVSKAELAAQKKKARTLKGKRVMAKDGM